MKTFAASLFAAALAVLLTPPFLLPTEGQFVIDPYRFGGGGSSLPAKTDLTAYWAFEDASTATAADSHGSLDLSEVGNVNSATGLVNNATDHETSNGNDYWNGGDAAAAELSGDWTITCWVRIEDTSSSFDRNVFSKYVTTGDQREYYLYHEGSNGTYRFSVSSDGTFTNATSVDSSATSALTWYFLAMYHEDGVGIGISVNAGTFATAAHTLGTAFGGTAPFWVGNGPTDAWDGKIDELAIWNKKLSQTEIDALYNSGAGVTYSDLP